MRDSRLQIRIDPKLKERAERLAKRRHTTLSAFIVTLLTSVLESDETQRRLSRGGEEAEQI
jgi:antitoxin component of RelBE/YafQ-DinJ toxin-antitoxin module